MSKIQIQNIFFDKISENFDDMINSVIEGSSIGEENAIKKLKSNEEKVIELYENHMIDLFLETKLVSVEKFVNVSRKNQDSIVKSNKKAFKYFMSYINCCHTIYNKAIKEIPNKSQMDNTNLCIAIYGIIIRKSDQISSLLFDGYIDGAMVIWRTLYENFISLTILLNYQDEELAKKFIKHSIKNTKKKAESFTEYHKDLGFNSLDQETTLEINRREKAVNENYGKEFIKNEYGWADDLIKGKAKASLRLLAKDCQMDYFRPYYLLCCDHTHAGFDNQSFFNKDGIYYLNNFLEQTANPKEFVDPMQFTIAVLQRLNDNFLHAYSIPHEYYINISLLKKITDKLQEQFEFKSKTDSTK